VSVITSLWMCGILTNTFEIVQAASALQASESRNIAVLTKLVSPVLLLLVAHCIINI
jgi:hypothetical protein